MVVNKCTQEATRRAAICGERAKMVYVAVDAETSQNRQPPFFTWIPDTTKITLTAKTVPAPKLPWQRPAATVATVADLKTALLLPDRGA